MKKPTYVDNVKYWKERIQEIRVKTNEAFGSKYLNGYAPEAEKLREEYRAEIFGLKKGDSVLIVSATWDYSASGADRNHRIDFLNDYPGIHIVDHITPTGVWVKENTKRGDITRWNRLPGSATRCGAPFNRNIGRRGHFIIPATPERILIYGQFVHAQEKYKESIALENKLLRDYCQAAGSPKLHTFGPFAVMAGKIDNDKFIRSYHCVDGVWKNYFGPDDIDDDAEEVMAFAMFRIVAASVPHEKRIELIRMIIDKTALVEVTALALKNRAIRKGLVDMIAEMDDESLSGLIGTVCSVPHDSKVTDHWQHDWNSCPINQPFDLGYDHQQTI